MIGKLAAAAILTVGSLGWQNATQPVRGVISGVVLSAEEPARPVRRAMVTVTGGSIPSNLSAVTDDEGRFRFVDLSAGRYTISVSKAGYLSTMYGATKAGRPGTSIALASDQQMDVRVRLPKGAVITGIVRDQMAQQLVGAEVAVAAAETASGASGILMSPNTVVTNDRGEYRVFGLSPGEYLVYVRPPSDANGDVIPLGPSDFDAKARALETRAAATGSTGPAIPAAPPTLGFAPTFYPGTTIAAEAGRVRVASGDERAGVDIAFVPVPTAHISGVIQGAGVPITRLMPSLTTIGPAMPLGFRSIPDGPHDDGSFAFSNVTPGRYVLMVRSGQGAMMRTVAGNGGTDNNPDIPAMFAMQELVVTGRDIGGIVLSLRPSIHIKGTIVFDATSRKAPDTLAGIGVSLNAVGPSLTTVNTTFSIGLGLERPPTANATANGGFELVGVLPGTYTISSAPAGGWWLRSVAFNGRDLLDDQIEINGSSTDIVGVVLTFSDRPSGITGTLTAAPGQPAPDFTVMAFPTDRGNWKTGSRRIKTTRPSSDGSFTLSPLPAGEYFLAALTDIEPGEAQQAAFLEQLMASAVKITVTEGQQAHQDLRVAR